MMKVAIDCREFYEGRLTGIGRFLSAFITCASRKNDIKLLLYGSQNTVLPGGLAGGHARTLYESGTRHWEQVLLPRALKRDAADIFFSPYPKTCLLTRIPSVLAIHDLTWLLYPDYRGGPAFLRGLLARAYAWKASAVLTLSEHSRADIIRVLGVPERKLFVTRCGVDALSFRPRPGSGLLPAKYGLRRPYILYVGNSNPHKNLDGLIKAYAALPAGVKKEYDLVLCGVKDYTPPIVEGGACLVLRYIPDQDLPVLYSGAALFVFPSFYEGFGLPPLEAMACGCPVAASSASCLPEILGDACAYFDPGDISDMAAVIAAALGDPVLRAGLKARGKERAALYSPEKTYAAIRGVFDAVLGGAA